MAVHHGVVAPGSLGVDPVPQEFLYTGVMENLYGGPATSIPINLADLNPGVIRLRREESNPLGSAGSIGTNRALTIPRSIDILDAGISLIPCLSTDSWSSKTAFTDYLTSWLDALADYDVAYWEIGNEPSSGGTLAQIRAKYLDYMTDARPILTAYGRKLMMSAVTPTAGSTQAMLDDINSGISSAAFSQIDGYAIHPYTVYASDHGVGFNGSYTSVAGYRSLFNQAPYSQSAKPMFITEIGWSCAVRADGVQHGDWNGQPPEMLSTDISITRADQAANISTAFGDLVSHRAKSALYLKAIVYFGYHDYGIPNENWDRHCGLVDISEGKRPSYSTLKNLQRQFTIAA